MSSSILGLTFDEFCAAAAVHRNRPNELTAARQRYAAALRGELCTTFDIDAVPAVAAQPVQLATLEPRPQNHAPAPALHADFVPVIRHIDEGDLTKFIQRIGPKYEIESVIVPMSGRGTTWKTLCISSQVGCAMGCTFCETAQLGLLQNLAPADIVGQAVAARRVFGAQIRNIVFMGMGEPLDNFDNVVQAVRVMSDPSGMTLAKGHITISTVGRIDGIQRLAALGWKRLNLAVSLNAPNDEIRSRIMPINRRDNMAALRQTLVDYPLRTGGHILIAYVLIPGVNDERDHARELADWTRGLRCCVNLIPYNPRIDSPWPAPSDESVMEFLGWLKDEGQYCKRRITKGRDNMAACGQLGNRELSRRRRSEVESV